MLINSRKGTQGSVFPCPHPLALALPQFVAHFTQLPLCVTRKTILLAHYKQYLPKHLCVQPTKPTLTVQQPQQSPKPTFIYYDSPYFITYSQPDDYTFGHFIYMPKSQECLPDDKHLTDTGDYLRFQVQQINARQGMADYCQDIVKSILHFNRIDHRNQTIRHCQTQIQQTQDTKVCRQQQTIIYYQFIEFNKFYKQLISPNQTFYIDPILPINATTIPTTIPRNTTYQPQLTYKQLYTELPYDIPKKDRDYRNLTLVPYDDQPWKLYEKPRRPPTQKLIYTRYTRDLYPQNLTCSELEIQGYCQRTYYAKKMHNRVIAERIQIDCPYLCNHHQRAKRNTLRTCVTIMQTENCYDQQRVHQCQQSVCNPENCKVTLETCSQDTYLGYVYDCSKRSNITLWDYNQQHADNKGIKQQANWMQYHPHTSVVQGYAISAVTWNSNRTAYRQKTLTKQHLWAVYNYITTICTTPTSLCYQAQQTPVYKNGAQFQWEIVHAAWTADQSMLTGNQFKDCLSFMGQETDNITLQILRSYRTQDMPANANLTAKQEYFTDGFASLCPRLNQWIIFKRPQKHRLTPYQMKAANVTITVNKNSIEIHDYNLTLPILREEERDGQRYYFTQTHQIITPVNITPETLRYLQIPNILHTKISPQQRRNIQQQWNQQHQIQYLKEQVAKLQRLTSQQQTRTKQLGDLTAYYTCRRIIDYQPVWSRKLDQACYHQLPIILPNTAHLPLSKCIWKHSLPAFLQQLATYINQTKITKEILLQRWMYQVKTSTALTYEQTQLLLLKNITREGLTYTCPFSPNPEKIVFVDIPSRQIVQPTVIDCHTQYPVYLRTSEAYYEVTNQGQLIEIPNDQINTPEQDDTTEINIPSDYWEEKIPLTVHYDTMPAIVNQARHQQFEHKVIQLQQKSQQIEQMDVHQLRTIIKEKEDVDIQNWNNILKTTNDIQKREHNEHDQYQKLSLTLQRFQQIITNLSTNQVILREQVIKINETITRQILHLQTNQRQLTKRQKELIEEQGELQQEYQKMTYTILKLKQQETQNEVNITNLQKQLVIVNTQLQHQAEQIRFNDLNIDKNQNNIQTLRQKQRILRLQGNYQY